MPTPAPSAEKKAVPATPPATPPSGAAAAQAAKAADENVVLITSHGRIVIDLFEKDAPAHCENFKRLVRTGYLNGVSFHRVCPGFAQSGDPAGSGKGGLNETIPPEIKRPHLKGSVVAAARDSKDPKRGSHGSQFFIMKIAYPKFDGQYTVFGQVIEGMDVVDHLPEGKKGPEDYQVPAGAAEKIVRAELISRP
jgi:cyclophilin family peptidyl-prolyl cis-trans isomerase